MSTTLPAFLSRLLLLICFCNYLLIFVANKSLADEAPPKTLEELKAAIEKIRVDTHTPAVGIALVDKNGPYWVASLGEANIEHHIKADENTMYRIASISKMFVAVSVLKLVEEGKLHLEDKVHDLAPEIEFDNPWEKTNPILLVHLLEHTTGWNDVGVSEHAYNDPNPIDLKTALTFHAETRKSRWTPGTRWAYNNIGPTVAAYIIEKVTQKRFEDYVQEIFFDPLGMEKTTYFNSSKYKEFGASTYNNNQLVNYWNQNLRPSGALNASPKDMAKFLTFLIQRGEFKQQIILSSRSIDRMERSEASLSGLAGITNSYGLLNEIDGYNGFAFYGHGGYVPGSLSALNYLPQKKIGFIFMMNADNWSAHYQIEYLLRDFILKNETLSHVNSSVLPEKFKEKSGWYRMINPRQETFRYRDNLINIQHAWFADNIFYHSPLFAPWTSSNYAVNENLLVDKWSGLPSVAIVRDPLAGEVLQMGQDTFKRIPTFLFFTTILLLVTWIILMLSNFLFTLIWIPRLLLKKIAMGPSIALRTWPVLASILFLTPQWLGESVKDFDQWAKPTFTSVSVTICTFAYAIVSIWCLWLSIRHFRTSMNRWVYWHSAVLSFLHLLVVIYLLNYGIIGIRTWAN